MTYTPYEIDQLTRHRARDAGACEGGCRGCKALADMPRGVDLSAGQFILGVVWVFVLPIIGLIGGTILAGRWEGSSFLAGVAIAGGLAVGVIGGVAGRRLTLRVPSIPGIDVQREERWE